jgi:Ran GTPase-activating protein (RanGAP) involved in mRNA processing and transport
MLMLQSWVAQEKFRDKKAFAAESRNDVFASCCHDVLRRPLPLLASDQLKTDTGVYSTHNKKIGKHLMQALVASLVLPSDSALRKIDLSENQMDDACAPELSALLEGRKEITTLWLRGNHFSSAFCKVMSGGSSSSYCLTDVDLSSNPLGDSGLKHIAVLLDKCPDLSSLSLSRCKLHVLSPLDKVLASSSLTSLDLSWNLMSVRSSVAFATLLRSNTSLTSLNCAWNHFGGGKGQICGALAHMLEHNSTLHVLDLSNNGIGEQDAFILSEAVFVNKGLRQLILNGNSIGVTGGQNMFGVMDRKGFDVFNVALHGCNMEQHDASMTFDPALPEGHHRLELAQPYQRAIAMSLYRKCCESGPDIENWKVGDV